MASETPPEESTVIVCPSMFTIAPALAAAFEPESVLEYAVVDFWACADPPLTTMPARAAGMTWLFEGVAAAPPSEIVCPPTMNLPLEPGIGVVVYLCPPAEKTIPVWTDPIFALSSDPLGLESLLNAGILTVVAASLSPSGKTIAPVAMETGVLPMVTDCPGS